MSGDRKIGENFDAEEASDIFDKLKNVEGKVKPKKEDSHLEGKGNLAEAIELYKQVIFALPDSTKAYEAIADIYKKQGDVESEKDILKKAISNCNKNDEFKKRLDEIN